MIQIFQFIWYFQLTKLCFSTNSKSVLWEMKMKCYVNNLRCIIDLNVYYFIVQLKLDVPLCGLL